MRPALDFAGWFIAGVATGVAVFFFEKQRRHECPRLGPSPYWAYTSGTTTGSADFISPIYYGDHTGGSWLS